MPVPCGCCPIKLCGTANGGQPVFACRTPGGVLRWYDAAGNQVPNADVIACVSPIPVLVTALRMDGNFFGDGPDGLGENICAVSVAPSSMNGFGPVAGGCFDPTISVPNNMTWNGPLSSLEMQYGNPPRTSGGVHVLFSSLETGLVNWPTNGVRMLPGQVRRSNNLLNGIYATLTYISGPSNLNAPFMAGGQAIGLHFSSTDNSTPPVRYRIDFWTGG